MSTAWESDGGAGWPPTFRRELSPLVALIGALTLVVIVTNAVRGLLLADAGVLAERLLGVASSTIQIALALAILRREGIDLREIGASRRHVLPAVVGVVGVVALLNAVVAGIVVVGGSELSPGLHTVPSDYSTLAILVSGAYFYFLVGPAEELAFRGYVQNKVIDELGDDQTRKVRALGIAGAAVLFALIHLPAIFLSGTFEPGAMAAILLLLTASGVGFGLVYDLTRNLVLVALLHGIGNWWPIFVDPEPVGWPNWGIIVVCYAVLVVVYRWWVGKQTDPAVAV